MLWNAPSANWKCDSEVWRVTGHYYITSQRRFHSCIVLHNICILNGEVEEEDFGDEIDEDGEEEVEGGPAGENANSRRMRDHYIERNF